MAYKTFANGFPLPASDLNNFLMNQSVIVFADAAARTTAIPSPVTGMLTYLEDTSAYESWNGSAFVGISNPGDITAVTAGTGLTGGGTTGDVTLNVDTAQFITSDTVTTAQDLIVADGAGSVTRLGVGTDDQVLSVVAGAVAWTNAGGGSLTEIATISLSSTTTITGIPQTYKGLKLILNGFSVSTSGDFFVKPYTTSSSLISTRGAGFLKGDSSPGIFSYPEFSASQYATGAGEMEIMNYAETSKHFLKFFSTSGDSNSFAIGTMITTSTAPIGELQIGGQTFANGTVTLYGIS